jgi:hypothetical protein
MLWAIDSGNSNSVRGLPGFIIDVPQHGRND